MNARNDEAIVAMKCADELDQVVVRDVGTKLAIELVHGFGRERMIVDRLDGGADLVG